MILWFISDTHFGHESIIKYCHRPFVNAREMDTCIIERWNACVKPQDHIYHLGDVTMDRGGRQQKDRFIALIKGLHGHKRLLLGNHDHFPIQTYLDAGFEKIYGTWLGIENIILSHIPIHPNSMGGAIANVHGHTHNNQEGRFSPVCQIDKHSATIWKPYINISIEMIDYRPITLDEIQQRIRMAIA